MNVLTYRAIRAGSNTPRRGYLHGEVMNLADVITFQGGSTTISRGLADSSRILGSVAQGQEAEKRIRTLQRP